MVVRLVSLVAILRPLLNRLQGVLRQWTSCQSIEKTGPFDFQGTAFSARKDSTPIYLGSGHTINCLRGCSADAHCMPLSALALLTLLLVAATGLEAVEDPVTLALPPTTELNRLAEIVAEATGLSLQYSPQKLTGSVNLAVRGELSQADLWAAFNQVLYGQGFTTVVSGTPLIYQVVPVGEAAGQSVAMSLGELEAMTYAPGYAVVALPLAHVAPEPAVKLLGVLFTGQVSHVRSLGERELVISAPVPLIREARRILALVDRPGVAAAVRPFKPSRTAPQALQAAAAQAWASFGRIQGNERPADIQVAPDGQQVLLVAAQGDIERLLALVADLDRSEPVEVRTYRPAFFAIDEVATLLLQVLKPEDPSGRGVDVVRDSLTNSLIVTATTAQHARIGDLLRTLEETPASSRRQMRSFVVRNRNVDDLAKVVSELIDSGISSTDDGGTTQAPRPPGGAGAAEGPATVAPPLGANVTTPPPMPAQVGTAPRGAGTGTTHRAKDDSVVITTDPATNRLICLGEPRALTQIATLLGQLDQRQPQVELEVILVTLSSNQSRDLGIELAGRITRGEMTGTVSSLFGLSSASAADPIARQLSNPAGLGGVVINPGDYAGVVRALETIATGRSLIRSLVVVANNGKATVNGVVQEPVTSINSGDQVATTSYAGTSDAGTQLTIEPQISAADHVTLTYAVSQSAFLGDPTVTANGGVIPPTKRTDSVSSVATIPDGFVIALGGLSNRSRSDSESRLPFLGGIPILGHLFKSQSRSESDSRFYVFIRANVLRHAVFADLRRSSDQHAELVPEVQGQPRLRPELIK
jgi:type II secretory pathway component GspD/PulD (secretin)